MFNKNESSSNKEILYDEQNPKSLKKKINKFSIERRLVFDSLNIKEKDNIHNQIKIKDNNNKLRKVFEMDDFNNNIISKNYTQPEIIRNNNKCIASIREIDSVKEFGLLDDFFHKLENEETKISSKKDISKENVKKEDIFEEKKEYFPYFHLSRTQDYII